MLPLKKSHLSRRSVTQRGLVIALLFTGVPTIQAATLELHSGQIVQGQIVSQDEDSYKLDTGIGFPVTYFTDEIKSIDGQPLIQESTNDLQAVETPQQEPIAENPSVEPLQEEPSPEPAEQDIPIDQPVSAEPIPMDDETADGATVPEEVIDLEGIPLSGPQTDQVLEPMKEVISNEINQMMLRNGPSDEPTVPVLRNGPDESYKDKPAEDLLTVEAQSITKEHPSPFGPTVKPKADENMRSEVEATDSAEFQLMAEVMKQVTPGNDTASSMRPADSANNFFKKIYDDLFGGQKFRLIFTKDEFTKKWPVIKDKLYQLPVSVRRDILFIFLCLMAIVYIFVCYPFMNIARRLGKKHSWIVWVPFAQWVYYVYVAGKPLWWSFVFLVPVVNYFFALLLFVDILKALKKPFWIIILIILPGINIFTLWYLAISQTIEAKARP